MKTSLLCVVVVLAALAVALQAQWEQPTVTGQVSAESTHFVGAPPSIVVLSDLPQMTPATAPRRPIEIPLGDGRIMTAQQPGVPTTPTSGLPSPAVEPLSPATTTPLPSNIFLPPNTGDEASCGFFIPSDQALATTTTYVVQVINSCIIVLNASTGVRFTGFPKSLNAFFGVSGVDVVGDPRALYDPANNRFVVVAEDFTNNTFQLAASTSGNPTSTWRIYKFSASLGGVGCGDYPMLGQTMNEINDPKGALILSWDRFACGGPFLDDEFWTIPKTNIYGGTQPLIWVWFNLTANGVKVDHVQPANVVSRADRPRAEFLVNTFNFNSGCFGSGCNGLVIWASYNGAVHVGANTGSPSLSARVISTPHNYIQPITAAQPGAPTGNGCAINTGTVGITGTVNYSAGRLFAAATTAALNGVASDGFEYWEIQPYLSENNPPTFTNAAILNEICWGCFGFSSVSGDNTMSEYYPTVQPDDEGNVTIVYNFSTQFYYPAVGFISKRITQAPGTFAKAGNTGVGTILHTGGAFYCQLDSFNRNRWGDGTATSAFGTSVAGFPQFWFAGSYVEPNASWGTAIGRNGFTSLTQP
jgi:hypothetical protein